MTNVYLKYAALAFLNLLSGVVNLILAPVVAMCADKDGWLPKWLCWFQTPDNSLNGDGGWQTENRWFLVQDTLWKQWLNRVGWMYRNPMYGFAIDVLGAQAKPGDELIVTGDKETDNHRATFHAGTVRYTLLRDGKPIYFQIYTIDPWWFGRYLRLNLGWKLWSMPTTEKMQFTFSPNPFRKVP